MIRTIEGVKLLDKATELAHVIKASDVFERYVHLYDKLQKSDKAQAKVAAFTKIKQMYEEVERFGTYHSEYEQMMDQVRKIKREMDLDDDVANFKQAENALQLLLDTVSVIIGRAVSEHIKVPVGDPSFEQVSTCNSGCASGNGCGCAK